MRSSSFEAWLVRSDTAALWPSLRLSPWTLISFEVSYMMCYALVPAAFLIVWTRGADTDVLRFWFALLLAGYACYGTIPWLVSRPPRLLDGVSVTHGRAAAANLFVLSRVTHQLNTFPSGHVAVAGAAALATWPVWRPAGLLIGIVAMGVAAGAVTGRYHYRIDVVLGAVVAIVATLCSWYL